MGKLTDAEILAQLPAAQARGEAMRASGLHATSARYDRARRRIILELTNGFLLGVPVLSLPALAAATASELAAVEVSAQGTTLSIPALDADYSVAGLVLSLAARENGRRGGAVTSRAKTDAARANGAKGGRPPLTRRTRRR